MRKITILIVFLCVSTLLISCKKSKTPPNELGENYYYVRLSFNPTLDFIVNENHMVVGHYFINDDAKLLVSNSDYISAPIQSVISDVIETAYETGYLSPDTHMQAIAIGVSNEDDALEQALSDSLIITIQDTLDSLALEAFILSPELLNDTVMELIDTHNLSLGHALLLETYQLAHPEESIASLLTHDFSTLIESALVTFDASYASFVANEEASMGLLKSMLIADSEPYLSRRNTETFVPINRQADLDTFIQNKNTYLQTQSEINSQRFDNANALVKGLTPSYLEGEYIYEVASQAMPYIVLYHYYTLLENGLYTEHFSWASSTSNQTTTGQGNGTWEVVNQRLILTTSSNFKTEFSLLPSRIVRKDPIGFNTGQFMDVYFKRS